LKTFCEKSMTTSGSKSSDACTKSPSPQKRLQRRTISTFSSDIAHAVFRERRFPCDAAAVARRPVAAGIA